VINTLPEIEVIFSSLITAITKLLNQPELSEQIEPFAESQ
jgi:hypothetical protein